MLDYIRIGKRIRHFRKHSGYTQEQLGLSINTSGAYISNIERAKKKPSLENLASIAETLGITINDLVEPSEKNTDFKKDIRILMEQYSPNTRSQLKSNLTEIINILEQTD